MGHFVIPYKDGEALAESLVAVKPNDLHAFPVTNQLLTPQGWKNISDLTEQDQIAQWDNGLISFVSPTSITLRNNNIEDLMHKFTGSSGFSMTTTNNHRVIVQNRVTKKYETVLAKDLNLLTKHKYSIPLTGTLDTVGLDIPDYLIQLIVATQADGHLNTDSSAISFTFTKDRKIQRLTNIIKQNNIKHSIHIFNRKGRDETTIRLQASDITKSIRKYLTDKKQFSNNLLALSYNQKELFLNEIQYWDGTVTNHGTVILETTDFVSADLVHTMLRLVNKNSICREYTKVTNFNTCKIKRVTFTQIPPKMDLKHLKLETYESTELVGCVSVPSTYILVKENDSIFVSGNCLDEETQILTKQGWQYFRDISIDTNVAQWDSTNNNITFSYPIEYIKQEYKGAMISVEGDRLSILMTPEHRNVVYDKNKQKFVDVLAEDLTTESGIIPTSGLLYGNDIYHEHIIQAVLDKFTDHAIKVKTNNGYTNVIKKKSGFVLQSSDRQFLEQIQTDLCKYQVQSMLYEKKIKRAAYSKEEVVYQVFLPFKSPNLKGSDLKHTFISKKDYDGFVYCVTVDTSYIICKRNNHIFITGNSVNARKLGITRDEAKSFSYATLYRSSSCKTCQNVRLLAA